MMPAAEILIGQEISLSVPDNPGHPWINQGALHSPLGEPAFLASLPGPLPTSRNSGPDYCASLPRKQEIIGALLQEHYPSTRTQDLVLVHSRWGKPHLLLNGAPGPGVSFSWCAGAWWAAVGAGGSWIGLDAASPREFNGAYPLHQVFSDGEWQAATFLTGGYREEAAALLWSVKEAVVKARGCGYHFCAPRQVEVEYAGNGEYGSCWRGRLAASGPDPAPPGAPEVLPVAAIRLEQVWLAVAWMQLAPSQAPAG